MSGRCSEFLDLGTLKTWILGRWWWCTPLIPAQKQAGLRVQGKTSLQSEFQDSQGYTEKPCLQKNQRNEKDLILRLEIPNQIKCKCPFSKCGGGGGGDLTFFKFIGCGKKNVSYHDSHL